MNAIGTYNNTKSILPQTVEWINVLCAIYLAATLILPFDYQRPALYTYFISVGLDIIVNKRYTNVKWDKTKWTFVAMILFYLCIWIWHPFEETNLPYFQITAEKRIGLLIMGLLGLFTNINPKLKPQHLAIPIMSTGIIILLYILYQIDFKLSTFDSFQAYQLAIANYRSQIMHISHMNFNLYMNCGFIFGFYGITQSDKLRRLDAIYCVSTALFMVLSVLTIITSEGRIGIFTTLIIICILAYYYTYKKSKYLLIPFIIISIFVTHLIFTTNYRAKDFQNSQNPRLYIWSETIEMIKEKPILGYGISDGRSTLVDKLFENESLNTEFLIPWFIDFPNYDKYSLHAHNIFLESTIEFGIIGLILISCILFLPIILTKRKQQLLLFLFILIFTLQGLTESYGSHLSIFVLSWFLYILILSPTSKTNNESENKQVTNNI